MSLATAADSAFNLETTTFTEIAHGASISTNVSGLEAAQEGYQYQFSIIDSNGDFYTDFDIAGNEITINNITSSTTFTISLLGQCPTDGIYIKLNDNPTTPEYKATWIKVNDAGHDEYYLEHKFQEGDMIQVAHLKNGIETPYAAVEPACANNTDVILVDDKLQFAITCTADLYIEKTGKIWVEAERDNVTVTYNIPEHVTLTPQPET